MAVGVFAVSTAAIFTRLAQGEALPSLLIAAARMIVAALVLTPLALLRYRAELRALSRAELGWCVAAALALVVHFAAWITSLEYTSVVASVVLVTTNPLFVALLSFPMLGERVPRVVWVGILLAFVGGVIVALSGDAGDPPTRSAPLLGNVLALVGAVGASVYLMIGRRLRVRMAVVTYAWVVYSMAALGLLALALLNGEKLGGYSTLGYAWLLMLGLVPQLIGHSSFNYALGFLPAAFVSVVILGEPVGSGILAVFVLNEYPTPLALVGSVIVLAGIYIATRKPVST